MKGFLKEKDRRTELKKRIGIFKLSLKNIQKLTAPLLRQFYWGHLIKIPKSDLSFGEGA